MVWYVSIDFVLKGAYGKDQTTLMEEYLAQRCRVPPYAVEATLIKVDGARRRQLMAESGETNAERKARLEAEKKAKEDEESAQVYEVVVNVKFETETARQIGVMNLEVVFTSKDTVAEGMKSYGIYQKNGRDAEVMIVHGIKNDDSRLPKDSTSGAAQTGGMFASAALAAGAGMMLLA